jgi:hypothetical protein
MADLVKKLSTMKLKDSQQLAKKGLHLVNEPALQVLLLL